MKSPSLSYRFLPLFSSLFILFVFLSGCSHHAVPVDLNLNQNGISAIAEAQTPAKTAPISAAVTAPVEEAPVPVVAAAGPEASESSPAEAAVVPQNEKNASAPKKENGDEEQSLLDTALELTETAQEYWEDGDMEQSIEALDQAYALILKVPGNNPKLSQQKEDLRFVISKRIMEMYASRKTSTVGTSAEIPMTMNAHVEREIQSFQTLERDFFLESYKRSGRYRGEMVKALQEAGFPEELSWLPLIESGFKVRALSRSRALGLWQFIPSTGYKFGLKRNAWIDERLDPEKATAAAIAYFQELHQMFGDWATVLAAYNCGEGSVARAIRDQKIDYLDNFWDFYERLPRETARYFPRFLAVLAILKDPVHYGFNLEDIDSPLSFETVTVERPVHLRSVAETLGIEIDELKALNPELRRDATPNIAYPLKVPVGKGETLLASVETLAKWTPPKVEYVVHRVRRGETLSLIALRYRTSIQRILEANNLGSGRLLRVGQRLKIPMRTTT
jgi:membrane-bound lytic murein transglycosylase D